MAERILVISAHPDDAELGAGGTIAKWIGEGWEVFYVVCTNGDKGSADPEMTSERLAGIRREEQLAAARVLGVKEVVFLDYPDGSLEDTPQFRGQLVRYIRQFKPSGILTTDPHRRYIWHRDHRICGRVALDAIFPYARDRLSYPEHIRAGLEPHKVRELYLWASEEPNLFVDITATFDIKLKAALCHHSQFAGHPGNAEARLRERASSLGQAQGIPLAETFYHLTVPF